MAGQNRQPKKAPVRGLMILTAVVLFGCLAGLFLFRWNRFQLELIPLGEQQALVEYGGTYTDPGVSARIRGTLILRSGWEPHVRIRKEGEVDSHRLGKQEILYTAEYCGLKASATRQIQVVDTCSPVITLTEDPDYVPTSEHPYEEEGFSAWDNRDGDITHKVIRQEFFGYVTYGVVDSSGNPAYVRREIPEYDFVLPEMTLVGDPEVTVYAGTRFEDPGCLATDNVDGDLSEQIRVDGEVV